MICIGTSKDMDGCNSEKYGCENCAYYKTENEVVEIIEQLRKERDYYKARYLEFNDAFIKKEGGQDYENTKDI